jgi:hypothetical protein
MWEYWSERLASAVFWVIIISCVGFWAWVLFKRGITLLISEGKDILTRDEEEKEEL